MLTLYVPLTAAGLIKKAIKILAEQPQNCSMSCYAISIGVCVVIAVSFVVVAVYLIAFHTLHGGKWKLIPFKEDPVRCSILTTIRTQYMPMPFPRGKVRPSLSVHHPPLTSAECCGRSYDAT